MRPPEARRPCLEPFLARACSGDRPPTDQDAANPTCPICGVSIPLGQGVIRDDDARVHMDCFDGVTRWAPSSPR
jgi:hypothetical protein